VRYAARALAILLAVCAGAASAAAGPPAGADSLVLQPPDPRLDSAASLQGVPRPAPASPALSKSPGTALLLSAILPGAGQVYNESYWKVPIIVGGGAWIVSQWISYDNKADEYRQLYEQSITPSDPDGDPTLRSYRDFYKDQRDEWTLYALLLYVATLMDAYVDASLFDFSVSEDLSLRVLPGARGADGPVPAGLTLRLGF
jgi:hypothetical protein